MAGSRVLVVGFGNPLAGDDGVGPVVVTRLRRERLPEGTRAEDGESDSLRLPSLWQGEPEVWIVDALASGSPPGTITRLGHEEVLRIPQRHMTAHHLSLPESLRLIALAHPEMEGVRYRLWGIEPAKIALLDPMSAPVRDAVSTVVTEILEALETPPSAVRRGEP